MPSRPKRHVLRKPAELSAVVSPVRHHLLRTLSLLGTASVRELAQELDRSPESLYYHLRALEKAGLVVASGERAVRGRSEALYSTVAEELVTDPAQTSPKYLDAYRRSASALLRLADRQLGAAIERQEEEGTERPVSLRIQQVQARLSPAAQRELARRLDAVIDYALEQDDAERGERVVVTVVSSPL